MGVFALLLLLRPLAQIVDVLEWGRGKAVAFDISVWLHVFALGCAKDLVLYKRYDQVPPPELV